MYYFAKLMHFFLQFCPSSSSVQKCERSEQPLKKRLFLDDWEIMWHKQHNYWFSTSILLIWNSIISKPPSNQFIYFFLEKNATNILTPKLSKPKAFLHTKSLTSSSSVNVRENCDSRVVWSPWGRTSHAKDIKMNYLDASR